MPTAGDDAVGGSIAGRKHIRVSLVTPNFNGADKLEKTLVSVLSQGYPNLEYIFVDGGSSDDSMKIVDRYRRHFSEVISEPDRGHTDAVNKGFARATGEAMGWINSDDILFPGSLALVNAVFQTFPDVEWITGRATALSEADFVYTVRDARPWSWLRFVTGDYAHIQQESTFWRRGLWARAGGELRERFSIAADFELWTRFFRYAPIYTVDALIGGFRFRDEGQLSRPAGGGENELGSYRRYSDLALAALLDSVPAGAIARYLNIMEANPALQPSYAFPRVASKLAAVDPPIISFDRMTRMLTRENSVPQTPSDFVADSVAEVDLLFEGDRRFVWEDGPDLREADVAGLDVVLRSHQFAPCGSAMSDSMPPMPILCGPIAVYDFGKGRFQVQLKFGDQVVFCQAEIAVDETLRLKVAISDGEYGVIVNGKFIAKGPITGGGQNRLSAHLVLGCGFLNRYWSGIALGARLTLRVPGAEAGKMSFHELRDMHGECDEGLWTNSGQPERPVGASLELAAGRSLSQFSGIGAGKRCFVMGNGPSLNKMDLSKLEGEDVFACNSAFLLFDRVKWRPKYYTCVDTRVLRDRAADIVRMLDDHPDIIAFFPEKLELHDGSKREFDTRTIIPPAPNRYYFNEVRNSLVSPPETMFSLDITERVVQPYTVAITMLQIAAYMGYSPIYLIGCDTSYKVPDSVRQEGPKLDGVGLLLTSTADDDPNHFDPTYFGSGREWHNPQVDQMIMHYGWAKKSLETTPVKVINATVGGNLEVFERAAFTELFPGSPPPTPEAPVAADADPARTPGSVCASRPSTKKESLERLLAAGLRIEAVLDVGVMRETWELREVFPSVKHYLFEPVREFYDEIRANYADIDYELVEIAASDVTGTGNLATKSIFGGEVSHSTLFDEGAGVPPGHLASSTPTQRLDDFDRARNLPSDLLLKVDVDGAELKVLGGATGLFPKVSCVVVEASRSSFAPRVQFLTDYGYALVDIVDLCYYRGFFHQCDLIFLKKEMLSEPRFDPWQQGPFESAAWTMLK